MKLTTGPRVHLDDADLVRYMDRQLGLEEGRRARAHLSACAECARRLEAAEAASAAVRRSISILPAELPDPAKRALALAAVERARARRPLVPREVWRPLLQAAAVVAIALGLAGVGTSPGRAWIAGKVEAMAGDPPGPLATTVLDWLGHPVDTVSAVVVPVQTTVQAAGAPVDSVKPKPPPRSSEPALPPGASPPVRFTPDDTDVVLVFQSLQRGGSATLWFRETPHATGQIMARGDGEALVPIDGGLEVRNRPESSAQYEIVVPVRYRYVRVRVADGPETLIPISKSKREWMWNLTIREPQE